MMEPEGAAGGELPVYDTVYSIDDMDRRLTDFIHNNPPVFKLSKIITDETYVQINNEIRVPKFEVISNHRTNLPSYSRKNYIVEAIKKNRVTIICGETGSGKSTQIPQYILNDSAQSNTGANIICTQPRRLAAMSLASRVAIERNSALGETVGYQIRNKSEVSKNTNLVFMTR